MELLYKVMLLRLVIISFLVSGLIVAFAVGVIAVIILTKCLIGGRYGLESQPFLRVPVDCCIVSLFR